METNYTTNTNTGKKPDVSLSLQSDFLFFFTNYFKPGDKSGMRKRPDSDYTRNGIYPLIQNNFLFIHFSVFFIFVNSQKTFFKGPSWPWSYGSWIYSFLCNQCLSPLMLWVRISFRARRIGLCDKVCQWLATGRWFSPGTPVSSTN